MKKQIFLKNISSSLTIFKIIIKTEPMYLLYALPQVILSSALPVLYVYFPKLIIEKLTDGSKYTHIAEVIAVYAAVLLIVSILNLLLKNRCTVCIEKFTRKVKSETGKIIMNMELKYIESSSFRDTIQLADNAAALSDTVRITQNIISNIITMISLAYIIFMLDFTFVILVILTVALKALFSRIQFNFHKNFVRPRSARNDRFGIYLHFLRIGEGGAKEIRINNLQKWIMEKVKYFRNDMLDIQFRTSEMGLLFDVITQIAAALQSLVVLWILAVRFYDGIISIAEFTMYFSAVTSLTLTLSSIPEQLTDFRNQLLNVSDLQTLSDLRDGEHSSGSVSENESELFKIPEKIEFAFENVSFMYPDTDKKVLDGINLTIHHGEKLVIVGFNGAGKSTFIKLICKFYKPSGGKITLNGTDIWKIPNIQYYQVISAVFQDFANFSFSLAENVSMSEPENADINKIMKIVSDVKLFDSDKINEILPSGYDTYLSKNFDSSGVELSGGQHQKTAVARAVYKDTPLIILDEPTANLDPKSESEIYENFFHIAKDKTAVFISHRLASSVIADNIAVFSDGKIEEYGSHDYLMHKNGIYADMYRKQSAAYEPASSKTNGS